MQLVIEYNFRLKYIYLYLTGNAQASFQTQGTSEKFHKKGTGESTGEQQGTGESTGEQQGTGNKRRETFGKRQEARFCLK
jgi:hypothetical protein